MSPAKLIDINGTLIKDVYTKADCAFEKVTVRPLGHARVASSTEPSLPDTSASSLSAAYLDSFSATAAKPDAQDDQSNYDEVTDLPGLALIHDGCGDHADHADRSVPDCLVDPNRRARVTLTEIIDHNEDRRAPHQSLLHAQEDVGQRCGPPTLSEDDH
eukprot:CAMPEP_0176163898 /NCGR_PEP_ID=MMETSP0120_2-20121206/83848_1 /TAXON_ID=160619 /ORGANISM="Kryptoperidinium foliaceum, Strain CCMP 1326" /LENGTH=158 /DNA_ID=CAMNT_0017501429 /DNA_START=147 /DNA_END=622 /DNA_ORIENTATION=-